MRMYLNSLVEKTGWLLHTKDNYLTPIFRYNLYHRLAEPGFAHFNPLIDSAKPPIRTGIRVSHHFFEKVLTQDCISMEVQLTILFRFDPRGAERNIIAQFAVAPDAVFEEIVKDYAGQALLQLIGRYPAASLTIGHVQNEIKNGLYRFVNASTAILGISIPGENCITFRHLMPHPKYMRTMLENANIDQKSKLLQSVDSRLIDLLYKLDSLSRLENLPEGSFVMTGASDQSLLLALMSLLNGRLPNRAQNDAPHQPSSRPLRPTGRAEAD